MKKKCVLYEKDCISCGECDMCDLDSNKKCNNCEKCLDDGIEEFRSLNIEEYIKIAEEKDIVKKSKK
jgi:hypothetical protein